MAHTHEHAHAHDANAYYTEQLFTIAVCGALGGVVVMLWYTDKLKLMLHPKFHLSVLIGGVAILALTVVRCFALWSALEEATRECTNSDDSEDSDARQRWSHDHGISPATGVWPPSVVLAKIPPPAQNIDHDHGWSPARAMVLVLPVMLYFLNLPAHGFRSLPGAGIPGLGQIVAPKAVAPTGEAYHVTFERLEQAALTPEGREHYEGKTVRLTGQYGGGDLKRCVLVRYRIYCCAADAVPLNAVIMVDPNSPAQLDPDRLRNQWVRVTGRAHFVQHPDRGGFLPALILYPTEKQPLDELMKVIPPPPDPFLPS
jgi:hypothetical protein